MTGHKIKIAGDDPAVGVYIVPVENAAAAKKVKRIAENTSGKIIGIVPESTGHFLNRVEIRTQFAGSGSITLKSPRVITSSFILEEN